MTQQPQQVNVPDFKLQRKNRDQLSSLIYDLSQWDEETYQQTQLSVLVGRINQFARDFESLISEAYKETATQLEDLPTELLMQELKRRGVIGASAKAEPTEFKVTGNLDLPTAKF